MRGNSEKTGSPVVTTTKTVKTMETKEQKNKLAHLLFRELLEATAEFVNKHPEADMTVVPAAGCLYLGSILCAAPTKEVAKATLENFVKAMRGLIEVKPDSLFGAGPCGDLNPN